MNTFKPSMTGEIVNISPIKNQNIIEEPNDDNQKKVGYTYGNTFYDYQKESYKKVIKTKNEIDELLDNGNFDIKKMSELNYQLMCQSLWLTNINKM